MDNVLVTGASEPPWWLVVLAVPHRLLDIAEGRLGLLKLRDEAVEPELIEKDIAPTGPRRRRPGG